jgi:hypothetical protein
MEILALLGALRRLLGTHHLRHFHPDVLREVLHGVDKTHSAVLHEEADRSAVRAAAEAVIELLTRTYRERGALFRMERAARAVIRARPF